MAQRNLDEGEVRAIARGPWRAVGWGLALWLPLGVVTVLWPVWIQVYGDGLFRPLGQHFIWAPPAPFIAEFGTAADYDVVVDVGGIVWRFIDSLAVFLIAAWRIWVWSHAPSSRDIMLWALVIAVLLPISWLDGPPVLFVLLTCGASLDTHLDAGFILGMALLAWAAYWVAMVAVLWVTTQAGRYLVGRLRLRALSRSRST